MVGSGGIAGAVTGVGVLEEEDPAEPQPSTKPSAHKRTTHPQAYRTRLSRCSVSRSRLTVAIAASGSEGSHGTRRRSGVTRSDACELDSVIVSATVVVLNPSSTAGCG